MGNESGYGAVDLVGSVLSRLGGDPDDDRERSADADEATPGREQAVEGDDGRPLTDGGADDAPLGDSPWAEDDPIVFGDESGTDHGEALLDAVTDADDESVPPFGAGGPDADARFDVDGTRSGDDDSGRGLTDRAGRDRIDPDRIDELEARIGALESDHVQLEASIADLATATTDLQSDVESVGTDVRQLVAMLGGIALATGPTDESSADGDGTRTGGDEITTDLEAAIGSRIDDALEAAIETTVETAVQESIDRSVSVEGTEAGRIDHADRERDDGTEESDDPVGDGVPEGIYRGVGDLPTSDPDAAEDDIAGRDVPSESAEESVEAAVPEPAASPEARSQTAAPEAEESGRSLVDPRTDAVGARLRQFREGFVDDPTADLPTGNTADEFRFEKILLPTDGTAAPDVSAGEFEKPYLEALPDGYAADAVVLEWLDWLVSAADCNTAAHAIGYYESIEWLTDDVRADLLGYLEGLGPIGADDVQSVDEPPEALDLQDHLRSLQYVTELASGEVGSDGI